MTINTDFFTQTYERSHGRKPMGRGRWAFIVMDGSRAHETVEAVFVPGVMTLADAKTWMRSYCRKHYGDRPQGFVEVEVAP
jgi:hypothetical protein